MVLVVLARIRYKKHRSWLAIVVTTAVMANSYYELGVVMNEGVVLYYSWKYVFFGGCYFSLLTFQILRERYKTNKALLSSESLGKLEFEWYKLASLKIGEDYYVERLQAWTRKIHQTSDKLIFLTRIEGNTIRCPYESEFDKLFYVERGSCKVNLLGEEKEYKKGDVIIIQKYELHNFTTNDGCWLRVVILKPDTIE